MSDRFPLEECDLCKQRKPYGNNRYDLQFYRCWQILICHACRDNNWDGLADKEKISRLFAHLDRKGIKRPPDNAKGWIDLPSLGS